MSQSIDRKTLVQALVLAALAPHWRATSPFEPHELTRRRLIVEALKIADEFLKLAGPLESPPHEFTDNGSSTIDPPF